MAAASLGVAAIMRRLRFRRAGLLAGLVLAALPAVTQQGHDARPYAMLTAAVVLASCLLLRLAADGRPRWLIGYGCALLLVGYMQMSGLLDRGSACGHLAGLAAPPGQLAGLAGGGRRMSGRGRDRLPGRRDPALELAEPGAEAGTLYVRRVSLAVLWRREHGVRRIFVVEVVPPWISPARYLAPGCRLAWQVQPAGMTARVWLYTR
jgi:hypothetical protein